MKHSTKITILAAMLASASMLTACSGGNSTQSSSSAPESSSAAEQTSAVTEQSAESTATESAAESSSPEEALPIALPTPDGYTVKPSEVVSAFGDEGELQPDQLTEDNWFSIECKDFGYAAEPTGYCLSSFEGNISDETETHSMIDSQYKLVKVGDKICGFTVAEAKTSYSSVGFIGGSVTLAESVTLTGWARLAPEDEVYIGKGDVQFIPDSESIKLPVVNYGISDDGKLVTSCWKRASEKEMWANEYPEFKLGNIYDDETTDADFSMLSIDGTYTRVSITIDRIVLNCTIDFYADVNAHVVDIEAI